MKPKYFSSALLGFLSLGVAASAHAQGPVFNGVGAGNLIDFTTWNLYGSASAHNSTPGNGFTYSILDLTTPGIGGQAGAAFAPNTVTLDFNQSFTVSFHFYINPGSVLAGDGMTFVLSADDPASASLLGAPLGDSSTGGSNLGYGGTGLPTSLAFAIDTFHFSGEPVSPSIQILENASVMPLAYTETGLSDIRTSANLAGQWYTVLDYTPSGNDDETGSLTGTIENFDLTTGPLTFSVTALVNGSGLHNVPLYYGFTAGNGLADDGHAVSSAVPIPEPETWAMLLAGLGLVSWRLRHTKV